MTWIWGLLIVLVILGGGYYLWSGADISPETTMQTGPTTTGSLATSSDTGSTSSGNMSGDSGTSAPMAATITYTESGFSPTSVTIKRGGTVTWVNDSGRRMWIASDEHPSHTDYAGTTRQQHCPDSTNTAFDQCAGETGDYSFTFDKVGTVGYHDHTNASLGGTVVVVE